MDEFDDEILTPHESLLPPQEVPEPEPPDLTALAKSTKAPRAVPDKATGVPQEIHLGVEESLTGSSNEAPPNLSAMLDAMDNHAPQSTPATAASTPNSTTPTAPPASNISQLMAKISDPANNAVPPTPAAVPAQTPAAADATAEDSNSTLYTKDDLLSIKTPKVSTGGLSSLVKDKDKQRSGKNFIRKTDPDQDSPEDDNSMSNQGMLTMPEEQLVSDTLTMSPDSAGATKAKDSGAMDFAPEPSLADSIGNGSAGLIESLLDSELAGIGSNTTDSLPTPSSTSTADSATDGDQAVVSDAMAVEKAIEAELAAGLASEAAIDAKEQSSVGESVVESPAAEAETASTPVEVASETSNPSDAAATTEPAATTGDIASPQTSAAESPEATSAESGAPASEPEAVVASDAVATETVAKEEPADTAPLAATENSRVDCRNHR